MRLLRTRVAWLLLVVFSLQIAHPVRVKADDPLGRFARFWKESYHGTPPRVCKDGAVEVLAENIDWLEHHIDRYGSIVAKQPDIWGEARLTKHRDEYERMMYGQLNQFEFTLNAAISQSDSSFLAHAMAISAAADKQTNPPVLPSTNSATVKGVAAILKDISGPEGNKVSRFSDLINDSDNKINIEPTIYLDQMSRYLNHLHELRRINEGDDTSDSPGYSMNLVRMPVSVLPGKLTYEGFGAEVTVTAKPYLSDDLLPTTFRNLVVEDLVDQLGLPLVRTIENVDAMRQREELRFIQRQLSELRSTLSQWSYSASDEDIQELDLLLGPVLDNETARVKIEELIVNDELIDTEIAEKVHEALGEDELTLRLGGYGDAILPSSQYAIDQLASFTLRLTRFQKVRDDNDLKTAKKALRNAIISMGQQDDFKTRAERGKSISEFLDLAIEKTRSSLYRDIYAGTSITTTSTSGRARRALHPVPPSQVLEVYGPSLFTELADYFCPTYSGRHVRWMGEPLCSSNDQAFESRVNLLDVQKWLRAELPSAHELLSQPRHMMLWYELARPGSGLAEAIRSGHLSGKRQPSVPQYRMLADGREVLVDPGSDEAMENALPVNGTVEEYRRYYFRNVRTPHLAVEGQRENYVLKQLGWALVVESALLNDRLNEDIRKTAIAKGCHCMGISQKDLTFFLPETAAREESGLAEEFYTATKAFQEYVNCRWPIHVFAIDPREQDQNVADVSARKRELQLALAVGFVSGNIGGNSLTQYSRTLESQIETISLNRTIVGFNHGRDTFGWRFYPRVQALDVPGAAGSIWQSIAGVDQEDDVCHRNLEPGTRECVAIVLMPSFVPYCDFTTRTNWFRLTNPKNSALTMKHTMRLSKAITAMRHSKAQCAKCAHCYRPGEINHLMTRVEQLDRELPLQSMRSLVPYENTLGGFEMFNTGVTDLSPELVGWYGAPGVVVDPNGSNKYTCGCNAGCPSTDAESEMAKHLREAHAGDTVKAARAKPEPICEGAGTTLFLVGDNFSVHDTKVIAGGVCIPHVRLISREIMRVTIPSCVNTVTIKENGKCNEYVAVYMATPYGVTNHLHVPVDRRHLHKAGGPASSCTSPTNEEIVTPVEDPTPSVAEPMFQPGASILVPKGQSDSCMLIPLPPVRNSHFRTVAFQNGDETEKWKELTDRLTTISTNLSETAKAQAQPTDLIVNVQSSETDSYAVSDAYRHKHLDGPIAKQMHTKVKECWRNLRDKLPCN